MRATVSRGIFWVGGAIALFALGCASAVEPDASRADGARESSTQTDAASGDIGSGTDVTVTVESGVDATADIDSSCGPGLCLLEMNGTEQCVMPGGGKSSPCCACVEGRCIPCP
jgi:hypothetical protein